MPCPGNARGGDDPPRGRVTLPATLESSVSRLPHTPFPFPRPRRTLTLCNSLSPRTLFMLRQKPKGIRSSKNINESSWPLPPRNGEGGQEGKVSAPAPGDNQTRPSRPVRVPKLQGRKTRKNNQSAGIQSTPLPACPMLYARMSAPTAPPSAAHRSRTLARWRPASGDGAPHGQSPAPSSHWCEWPWQS